MKELLEELKNVQSPHCISIVLNTHRTHPENQQDPILLKNLIKEAETRLLEVMDKRSAEVFLGKLELVAREIDHEQNLESLAIFVNEDLARYVRLPVAVTNRVVIDGTFATRDLVRTLHAEHAYYALVLSRKVARLVEAFADRPVRELGGDFPMDYGLLYTTDREERSKASGSDQLVEEFFNRVDKAVQRVWQEQPRPLVLVTEDRNIAHYRKVADRDHVIATAQSVHDDEQPHRVVTKAWEAAQPAFEARNAARVAELHKAVAAQSFLSDLNDIWRALQEGRGATLFVKRGYFQPARVDGDRLVPLHEVATKVEGFIDDAIDEMIEIALQHGGEAVFLDGDELEEFQNLALVTRW